MEPIVPIAETKPSAHEAPRGSLADLIACSLAALAAVVAFGYSILFFSRFLENDAHLWGVVSALLLCFGVGAFGYVPAGMTSLIALRAYKYGATKRALLWVIFLLLPWCVLALVLTFISDISKVYSVPILIAVLFLIAWVLISLRSFHKG